MTPVANVSPGPSQRPEPVSFTQNRLDALFCPTRIAIIGASEKEGSVGRALVENIRPFNGRYFLINPKRPEILGSPSLPNIKAVPEKVDLAVIATPAPSVPG